MRSPTLLNAVQVIALVLTAICVGPALAHLLELPNKTALARDEYFTVQQIYRGWALLGIPIVSAFVAIIALARIGRRLPGVLYWALTALLCLVAAQAVFWIFTYPANLATSNWTEIPENWQALRVQWEYSHAVGSILTLAAHFALIFSLLARARAPL